MNRHRKLSILLALVLALVFETPGGAWAGGNHYGGYRYGHAYQGYYSGHCYPGYYHGRAYYYPRYYYPRAYYPGGYACNTCGNNNHHNNNNDLWLGLLGGSIIGYTLNAIHQGY